MKKFRNIAISLFIILTVLIVSVCTYYNINMSPVSKDETLREISISEGTIESIGKELKANNLIRDVTIFKLYTRLMNKTNLKSGIYNLSPSMGVKEIVSILEKGSSINPDEIAITFKEGYNIRKIALEIEDKTNNSYDDVLKVMEDDDYIDELISQYWFLTDDIKNTSIYYPLEGYLYPNTYRYSNKDVSVKDIFAKMLDEMDRELTPLKDDIAKSKYSVHELLTLSSLVELEGPLAEDRKVVAGVFTNRINDGWALGSDVTTYYALKIDDWSPLNYEQLNNCNNKYNTRCNSYIGLPIGPIASPSITSIEAALYPDDNDYYYFVSDCDGNIHATKTASEHNNMINKLKSEGNWCA